MINQKINVHFYGFWSIRLPLWSLGGFFHSICRSLRFIMKIGFFLLCAPRVHLISTLSRLFILFGSASILMSSMWCYWWEALHKLQTIIIKVSLQFMEWSYHLGFTTWQRHYLWICVLFIETLSEVSWISSYWILLVSESKSLFFRFKDVLLEVNEEFLCCWERIHFSHLLMFSRCLSIRRNIYDVTENKGSLCNQVDCDIVRKLIMRSPWSMPKCIDGFLFFIWSLQRCSGQVQDRLCSPGDFDDLVLGWTMADF